MRLLPYAIAMNWIYPLCVIGALLLGMWIAEQRFQPAEAARHAYMAAIVGGFVGARLWQIVVYQDRWTILGGLSLWGALAGASVGAIIYLSARGFGVKGLLAFADAAAPAIALAGGLVRVGCFAVGCCFGAASSLPWAVRYGPGTPPYIWQVAAGLIPATASHSAPIHPRQIYECLAWFLAAAVLLKLGSRKAAESRLCIRLLPGELFFGLAVYYSVVRFALDFTRSFPLESPLATLSSSQIAAIVFGVAALAFLLGRRFRKQVAWA